MSTLPDWPDIAQYSVPGGFANGPKHGERGVALIRWGYSQLQEEVSYERARADAAMARLRLAVEAIHELKRLEAWVGDDMDSETELILSNAEWALKAIGPLPESP